MQRFTKGMKTKATVKIKGKKFALKRKRFRLTGDPKKDIQNLSDFAKEMGQEFKSKGWRVWVDIPQTLGGSAIGGISDALGYMAGKMTGEYANRTFKELRLTAIRQVK